MTMRYYDASTVEAIANKVEISLNSLKAISLEVQNTLSEVAGIVCNG